MNRLKTPQLVLLLAILVLVSCTRYKPEQTAPIVAYQEQISGVTSGLIKRSDPIVIRFTSDIVSEKEIR